MMMQITFTGHDIDVTDALKTLITKKYERVSHHFNHPIMSVNVILSTQKLKHSAEITVSITGQQIVAKAICEDMYKAIDQMIHKLDKQLIKHKEKMVGH